VSDLTPRPSSRMTRAQREQRAYRLTLATGGAGLATVAVLVLAFFGIGSFGAAFVLALLTAGLGFGLKRTLNP
jgi:uncharacterized membrane protein YjjP (DUF1212 family)